MVVAEDLHRAEPALRAYISLTGIPVRSGVRRPAHIRGGRKDDDFVTFVVAALRHRTSDSAGNTHFHRATSCAVSSRMIRQGLPAAMALAGTFLVTTLPAPMIALSPMVTPLRMTEFVPMNTRLPIMTLFVPIE